MTQRLDTRFVDGRLHLQHGPIDCIVEAWGPASEVELAYAQAVERFDGLLESLVEELEILRAPVGAAYPLVRRPVAKRMFHAAWPHRKAFITPMAAVAGAVAEELLEALVLGRKLEKAYVNNGGDIALHLEGYAVFEVGVAADPNHPVLDGDLKVHAGDPVRGVATSGWRGRSQSLGIADSVTVLAKSASIADAAATMIANAVNVNHPAIRRLPAREVKEDSDLGDRLVTVEVGALPGPTVNEALEAGLRAARQLEKAGLAFDALLSLQSQWRTLRERPPYFLRAQC